MPKLILGAIVAAAIMLAYPSLMTPQQSFAQQDSTAGTVIGAPCSDGTQATTYQLEIERLPGLQNCQFNVLSFSWGLTPSSGPTGGGGVGRAIHQDLQLTLQTSHLTPTITKACAEGSLMGTVTLTEQLTGGQAGSIQYVLTNARCASWKTTGAPQGVETDDLSLSFQKIAYSFVTPTAT